MKNRTFITIAFCVTLLIVLSILIHYAFHSTNEKVRHWATMSYYHTVGCNDKKREAARYLFDNMPYHYGYGVTVHDSKEVNDFPGNTKF